MGCHIVHLDTKVAAALVNEKCSGLENRLSAVMAVEVRKSDIIPDESIEITVQVQKFVN